MVGGGGGRLDADPTPFVWRGPRRARRERARSGAHALAGSGGDTRRRIPRPAARATTSHCPMGEHPRHLSTRHSHEQVLAIAGSAVAVDMASRPPSTQYCPAPSHGGIREA